ARPEGVEHPHVLLAPAQVSLDDDAGVAVALVPDAAEEVQRALGVGAGLHVEADEGVELPGPVEHAADVLAQERVVNVLPHLRELERHVGVEPLGGDAVQELDVDVGGGAGLVAVANGLAEEADGHGHTCAVERAGGLHRIVEGLARDEAPCGAPGQRDLLGDAAEQAAFTEEEESFAEHGVHSSTSLRRAMVASSSALISYSVSARAASRASASVRPRATSPDSRWPMMPCPVEDQRRKRK